MRRLLQVLGAVAPASLLAACGGGVSESPFIEPATSRGYVVWARRDHDRTRPAPVLFALHAYATSPEVLVRAFALVPRAAASRGWILVAPAGTRDGAGKLSWNASAACCGIGPQRPDDVEFLHRVLEDVRRRIAVDPERVYAIGVSNGAFMAHRWACAPSGDLRAIVSIAGAAQGPDDPPCTPSVPVSVLHVHGDEDQTIRYQGGSADGARYPSARESAGFWRNANGCSPEATVTRRRSFLFGDSRIESWSGPRARVALWTVEGGAHHIRALRFDAEEMLAFLEGK